MEHLTSGTAQIDQSYHSTFQAKEVRNMPIRKLLRQEQQMTTSIMNGFHAQPFTILQVTIQNKYGKFLGITNPSYDLIEYVNIKKSKIL